MNTEGLRTAMQQVWKSVREIKVESLGDNIFVFKFPYETEKKRVSYGGPWYFDKALMVLTEPSGVGDIKHQSFQYTSFWVQLYNVPLMCMEKDTVQEMGKKIGKVEEVETDGSGECIGPFSRVRVSVDITQSLKKVLLLEVENGEEILRPVLYEKVPEICFCCGISGHQYRICQSYKGQPKDQLAFGAWMKVLTKAEKAKQNRNRDRWNREASQPNQDYQHQP